MTTTKETRRPLEDDAPTVTALMSEISQTILLAALLRGETLWTLRYKGARGMQEVVVLARDGDPGHAQAVGRAWTHMEPGRSFISVMPLIVATGDILRISSEPEREGAAAQISA